MPKRSYDGLIVLLVADKIINSEIMLINELYPIGSFGNFILKKFFCLF